MADYEVWASNDPAEWTHMIFETNDKNSAMKKAQNLFETKRFKFIAVDHCGTTIWSNDPATPAVDKSSNA